MPPVAPPGVSPLHGTGPAPLAPSALEPAPTGAPAPTGPPHPVHEATTRDGRVTAVWSGTAPAGSASPEWGVRSLCFVVDGSECLLFEPREAYVPGDWSFDILAPDGAHVLLKQGHDGPIDVVATDQLAAYLRGAAPPLKTVQGASGAVVEGVPLGCPHTGEGWVDAHTWRFSCGNRVQTEVLP